MTSSRTRVVLVEEDRALCQRVERVLLRAGHAVLAAICPDEESALASLIEEQLRADIAVIDVRANVVHLVQRLAAERPDLTTVVLAEAEEDAAIFAALRAGAAGYIVATDDLVALRDRLVALLHGGATMSAPLAKQILETRVTLADDERAMTMRIATGGALTPADASLIRAVYRKLGASSRSDSVRDLFRRNHS